MYHSIDFFDSHASRNTYDDWKLIPTKRPVVSPPDVKTTFVDIPGSNGQLDLSEVVSKRPVYNQRKGDISFKVLNDYPEYKGWVDVYQKILNYLHGKKMKMILEDDPNYYYEDLALNHGLRIKIIHQLILTITSTHSSIQ